jgi:Mg-chelatase subunit ChlD
MDKKRVRITYGLVAGTLCLAAWAASAMPRAATPKTLPTVDPPAPQPPKVEPVVSIPKARPKIEVMFALDTTGSMSGLIEGAKRKIWSIANFIAQGDPKPDLRIGLIAYRDKGDAYVTRFYDLSDDLDKVFERLQSFEAAGGGDTPEHVSRALHEAVHKTSWSKEQAVLKQVYLVGDAPPHTDYNDGFDYRKIAKDAHEMGIHINTIRCGGDRQTQLVWNEIANSASGEYASIDQSGGVITVATPYDDKLAELNGKLVGTAVGWGRYRGEVAEKVSASRAMPKAAAADRAGFFGLKGGAVSGAGDLVKDAEEGRVDIAAAPAAALPAEVATLDADGRKAWVEKKKAERESIQAEINKLNLERAKYLKERRKADAFDARVEDTIRSQAKSIGVAY